GGRVVVVPQEATRSPEAFHRLLAAESVTVLNQTPSAFRLLARVEPEEAGGRLDALRAVILGGEAIDAESLRPWFERYGDRWPRLVNAYGITETTVFVTARQLSAATDVPISAIGPALTHYSVQLLDRALQPVPLGVPGEICVGGGGVSRGYLGRPELTAERFVPRPRSAEPGARLYRSGDLARRRPDGEIEYLGRIDRQVKVRGFRIELAEIEAVLALHPAVQASVVFAREERDGRGAWLVACVVTAAETLPELRAFARLRLPEHMVPTDWVALAALPLTANGKVDVRVLTALAAETRVDATPGSAARDSTAPRTPVEELLAELWAGVLGLGPGRQVSVHDSFFDLGGHSLLATRIIARVRDVFGVELPLASLFDRPTVGLLAHEIETLRAAGESVAPAPIEIAPRRGAGREPLSFAQERLWVLDRFSPGSPNFNILGAVRLSGELRVDALRASVDEIVRRHETLRTTYEASGAEAAQRIGPPVPLPLPVVDLTALAEAERRQAADAWRSDVAHTAFDLAQGPLLRLLLLRLAEREHLLLLAQHHIASDGWSMSVLVQELGTAYSAFAAGRAPELPPLPFQYADFAAWQRRHLTGDRLSR
ncbi:MAG TPA: condensation domain-containing protein, partial [Thermoanaerobaculia bacterium]